MIKHYLTIAWRNLLKHKTFSFVNICGLAIGIASCLVIFIYVHHELTYDQYNAHADRIARITGTVHAPGPDIELATTPAMLSPMLQKDYPEVEASARLEKSQQTVHMNNDYFKEEDCYWTDQGIFSIFSFTVLEGSLTAALDKPNSIVITSSLAKKYFGTASPIGKIMLCNSESRLVTAVIKDRPANSDIKIDALLSHDYSGVTEWMDGFSTFTYVLLKEKTDRNAFTKKLAGLSKKYIQPELIKADAPNYSVEFFVEPLPDVHFSQGKHMDTTKGNRQTSYIFSLLAVFILLIALLNYINLSTAKAAERAREVGIRKVSGAIPFQLIRQFLFESFFIVSIAWLISLALVYIALNFLTSLLSTSLQIEWGYILVFTAIVFIVTLLLAGLYPAFVLSSFKPVNVLKGNWRNSGKGLLLRKSITVTQFVIATALIMGATVIFSQMRYIEKKDLGYTKDQLMNIYLPRDSVYRGKVTAFMQSLRQQTTVNGVTLGGGMVLDGVTIGTTFIQDVGKKKEIICNYFPVDPDFLSVFTIPLLEGRNLSDSIVSDKKEAFLVNEAFLKMMGWQPAFAIGKEVEGWGHKGKIVGVVKNFYYRSLHNLVEPTLLVYNIVDINIVTVKTSIQHLDNIKKIYGGYFPGIPINYSFFDDIVGAQYEKDRTAMLLFNYFTILAIFISCLGLYGLVSLMAIHRTKEIGIRKVLGASLSGLLLALSKDFMKLVMLALVIALPVAGVLMHKWLQSYAYHETLAWWMFVVPAITVLLVAIIVISRQVLKTAFTNPVESLRME